jgi:glucosamine--fructose-6-phosphate aminotransferase (isomerizing)
MCACGTSWHAGLVMNIFFEELLTPVEVEYASEFRYRNQLQNSRDVVMLFLNQERQLIL